MMWFYNLGGQEWAKSYSFLINKEKCKNKTKRLKYQNVLLDHIWNRFSTKHFSAWSGVDMIKNIND